MSTVLVTGGSDFIGSHFILQLLAADHPVRTTVPSLNREGDVINRFLGSGIHFRSPILRALSLETD